MKEILIKTLEAYQEAIDKAKKENINSIEFQEHLSLNRLKGGICFYLESTYSTRIKDEFVILLSNHMCKPIAFVEHHYYCVCPSFYKDSIEDCIEKALKPRVELLTKMINEYESIN